jgi:hypothetical protein
MVKGKYKSHKSMMKNLFFIHRDKFRISLLLIPVINFLSIYALSMYGVNLHGVILNLTLGIGLFYLLFLGMFSLYIPKSNFFRTKFSCHLYIIFFWFIFPVFLNMFLAWLNLRGQ